jgi:hypothetical protein
VERHYTVVCEMADCNWRVCAKNRRPQKATEKFKITKNCRSTHLCLDRSKTEASTVDLYPHWQKVINNFEGSAQLEGRDNYGDD